HIRDPEYQVRDLAALLITTARNLASSHFSSSYRTRVTLTDDRPVGHEQDQNTLSNPEAAVTDYMNNRALWQAVRQLAPRQQKIITLRFLRDYSLDEVAAIMGEDKALLSAAQYRALKALRGLLPEGFVR